jgi:hypothetical protein
VRKVKSRIPYGLPDELFPIAVCVEHNQPLSDIYVGWYCDGNLPHCDEMSFGSSINEDTDFIIDGNHYLVRQATPDEIERFMTKG